MIIGQNSYRKHKFEKSFKFLYSYRTDCINNHFYLLIILYKLFIRIFFHVYGQISNMYKIFIYYKVHYYNTYNLLSLCLEH